MAWKKITYKLNNPIILDGDGEEGGGQITSLDMFVREEAYDEALQSLREDENIVLIDPIE